MVFSALANKLVSTQIQLCLPWGTFPNVWIQEGGTFIFLLEVIQINIIWLNLLPRISQSNVCNWPSIIRLTSEIEHNRIIVSLSWHCGYIISNRSLSTRTVDCGLRTTRTNLQQRPFLSRLALKEYSCIRKLKTSTLNSVYVLPFCRKISCRFLKIYLRLSNI